MISHLLLLALAALSACAESPRSDAERAPPLPPWSAPPRDTTAGVAAVDTAIALEIRFLDVGQGDAVLLRSGGRTAMVDTGPYDGVVDRLRALGVDTLQLLVASHNHADHIGGADALLAALPVRFYLDNGKPASTRIQERVLGEVERRGVTYLAAERRSLTLGRARLRLLPPPGLPGEEQNNHSVGVVVELGRFRALLTGDSEIEELSAWLAGETVPDVDLLKAAHHGSRNGVSPGWLARTRPEVVVISLGADNNYGHPHASALRYYCAGGRRVLRTDLSGEVTIRVAASGEYRVEEERRTAAGAGCAATGATTGQRDRP